MAPEQSSPRFWLESGLQALGLELGASAIEQLLVYFAELQKWNKKINLIGPGSEQSIVESHFLDSLTLLPLIALDRQDLFLDIGSGAGFPGLVLKIASPQLKTTLVEPRQKRAAFLQHICRTLGLSHINVLCRRIHANDTDFSAQHGPFSLITSRAVANVKDFLTLATPLCAEGCRVLCMKGPQAEKELEEWQSTESSRFFTIKEIHQFHLPFSQAERNLVIFTRSSN
jgi:16S rRNA (guanine527-N7)-methyltransferase